MLKRKSSRYSLISLVCSLCVASSHIDPEGPILYSVLPAGHTKILLRIFGFWSNFNFLAKTICCIWLCFRWYTKEEVPILWRLAPLLEKISTSAVPWLFDVLGWSVANWRMLSPNLKPKLKCLLLFTLTIQTLAREGFNAHTCDESPPKPIQNDPCLILPYPLHYWECVETWDS